MTTRADPAALPSAEILVELERVLRSAIARRGISHALIAVESGDRSFRWIEAAGDANPGGEPMRGDTPFFLASVTKLYTATAVLKLHERGLIGLDEPIATYLGTDLIAGTDPEAAAHLRPRRIRSSAG